MSLDEMKREQREQIEKALDAYEKRYTPFHDFNGP